MGDGTGVYRHPGDDYARDGYDEQSERESEAENHGGSLSGDLEVKNEDGRENGADQKPNEVFGGRHGGFLS